ncbi:gephyrin-like molybdotransferase receptor GlpR [[Mycobacterium] burgundiense]|uniref:Transmembrane protein n=1 Tax=[Mycobacterium] burgundiense TaxID=3064286 RepID=A0ABM9LDI0_9MYCO|nr:gephyrin-like molybdotransferase receptor GlpR [Mycolicibacterium sp. MU0053]CAJ1497208.1 hypothetical protein MU0053_000849 [Mycolicibacterium sp. MU0053]
MPSIPQSLLWISLVVLWLFVLVPMLVNKRDAVKRTSDVALATRVLNTGRAARLIKRGRPAAGHASDPDWQHDADLDDYDDDATGPVVVTAKPARARTMAVVTSVPAEDGPDYLDVDVVDEDSGALPVGKLKGEGLQAEELPLEFAETAQVDDEAVPEPESEETAGAAAEMPAAAAVESEAEPQAEEEEFGEFEGARSEYEYVEDTSGLEAEAEPATSAIPLSRDRRYHSKTAAAVSARKYRFRKNVLSGMALMLVASAGAAFLLSPVNWWVCGTVGVMTVLYLAYLRRQTRIEERLRRRRMQRMARSRLGVENTQDHDLDVVPARLRQPGAAVLEIDDEDPEFEHLEYVPFARQFDLPRAAGQ